MSLRSSVPGGVKGDERRWYLVISGLVVIGLVGRIVMMFQSRRVLISHVPQSVRTGTV